MLKVEQLSVSLGRAPVLERVSACFAPGRVTAVLGLNGAGKTTLIKCIMGLLRPAGGTVTVDGIPAARLSASERAKRMAYVPQKYDGGFQYTVEEFVSMGVTAYLGAFSQPGRRALDRARETLEGLGCGRLIGRSVSRLSGGEIKMAYLARAILQDARYLLLDEPVAALDFSRQHLYLTRLRRYAEQRKVGAVMSIHDPALAWQYADHILMLHGRGVLLDVGLDEPDCRLRLEEAIHTLYGPQAHVSFDGADMRLTWR